MKAAYGIFSALLTLLGLAQATQPMPDGLRVNWAQDTNAQAFYLWMASPNSTTWNLFLGTVPGTATNYLHTNAVADGTHFGVSVLKKPACTNCPATESDIGQAAWPPSPSVGPNTVRITPVGGVRLDTNRWARVSYDLVTFSDLFKVHNPAPGVVRVEHSPNGQRPFLFMAYPAATNAPPLPGGPTH